MSSLPSAANARGRRTQARLVAAAIEALAGLDVEDLLTAVGTRTIAARAGVSAPVLFHHFGSVEGLAEAVLATVYDPVRPAGSDEEIAPHVHAVTESTLPSEASMALHRGEITRLLGDPEHRLRVGLWAMGGTPGREAYGRYLRERDAPLHDAATRLYAAWGRELRPPLTVSALVAVHAALLSGAAIRGQADPDGLDVETYARVSSALGLVLLRPVGDRRDLDDRISEINHFPAQARGLLRMARPDLPVRRAVLDAADLLFRELGAEATSMERLARTAGVSTTTLYTHFASKDAIATALLLDDAAARAPGRPAGLEGCLSWVIEVLRAHHGHAAAYVASLLVEPLPDDPLRHEVVSELVALAEAGRLLDGLDTDHVADLADVLLATLAARVRRTPSASAADVVAHLERVLLRGWLVPAAPS